MIFPTLNFGIFFLIVFTTSWAIVERAEMRKIFLLAASYFFYGYWDWRFMALLAGSSAVNFLLGLALQQAGQNGLADKRKKIMLAGVFANLLVLGIFKYFEFFVTGFTDMLTSVGFERDIPIMEIILPIGISFFTFQGISYIVDIYRGKIEAVRSPVDLFLFISFFPQLVAGPIVRSRDFLPQLAKPPRLTDTAIAFGFTMILLGMFKKMVVAHYLAADIVDDVFSSPGSYGGTDLLWATYAYVVQIYCDFSGYSDMAIGLAALLGYRFKTNFDRPFAALSLQKLWSRWHMSLSSFLRDYLYRALRGAKNPGKARTLLNTFLVMLIGGLWHGAAWTFVIWGAINGAALVIERLFKEEFSKVSPFSPKRRKNLSPEMLDFEKWFFIPFSKFFGWFFTFHVFAWAAVFFRSDDIHTAFEFLATLWAWPPGNELASPFVMALATAAIAIQFAPQLHKKVAARIEQTSALGLGAYLGFGLLAIAVLAPEDVAPFIYFQF